MAGIDFTVVGTVEHSVTVKFDETKVPKKEVLQALKKFMKEDSYFSGLMVQMK